MTLKRVRFISLVLHFWIAFVLIISQIIPSIEVLYGLILSSNIFMLMDFKILRRNLLIYIHHILFLFLSSALVLVSQVEQGFTNEMLTACVSAGMLISNSSWTKKHIKIYAAINILIATYCVYIILSLNAPMSWLFLTLQLGTLVTLGLSYTISLYIIFRPTCYKHQQSRR